MVAHLIVAKVKNTDAVIKTTPKQQTFFAATILPSPPNV